MNLHTKDSANNEKLVDIKSERAKVPHYFTVSTRRMVILGILTLGAYEIYWSYKNWKAVKVQLAKEGNKKSGIHPILASIFFPLTAYELYVRVRNSQKALAVDTSLIRAGQYGWLIFLTNIVGLSFIPVATSQKYMNAVKLKAFGDEGIRKGTSWGEVIVVILVGFIVWGRIAEGVQSGANATNLSSQQAAQKKSEIDSLTAQYNKCSSDLAAKRATVDLSSQSAVDAFNAQFQTCDNVRLQQNKAVDDYNSLVSAH